MAEFDAKINQISQLLTNLVSDLTAVEGKVKDTAEAFDALAQQKEHVDSIQQSVKGLKSVLGKMDDSFFTDLEAKAKRLSEILSSVNGSSSGIQETVSQLREQASQLKTLITAQTEYIAHTQQMGEQIREFTAQNQGLLDQARQTETSFYGMARGVSALNTEVERLNLTRLRDMSSEVDQLRRSYQDMADAANEAADAANRVQRGGGNYGGGGYQYEPPTKQYEPPYEPPKPEVRRNRAGRAIDERGRYIVDPEDSPSYQFKPDPFIRGGYLFNRFARNQTTKDSTHTNEPYREQDLYTDPISNSFRSRGDNTVGASPQNAAANREAIRRAVEASPNKFVFVGTTGGNLGGASLIGGKEQYYDHSAIAYRDAVTKEIKILEMMASMAGKPTTTNRTGNVAMGTLATGARSFNELTGTSDSMSATPLMGNDNRIPEAIERFIQIMNSATKEGEAIYSFVSDEQTARKLGADIGETCASQVAKALEESGLGKIMAEQAGEFRGQFAGTGKATGMNTITPADIQIFAENYNKKLAGGQIRQPTLIPDKIVATSINVGKTVTEQAATKAQGLFGGVAFIDFVRDLFTKIKESIAAFIKTFASEPPSTINRADGPAFQLSPLKAARETLEKGSDVYRGVQFATSQGGAILNALREGLKGLEIGGPAGFLDISAAIIKAVNALVNLNNKFNLNLVPKGVGELFTQRRSDALIDLIEIAVGGKTAKESPTGTAVRQESRAGIDKSLGKILHEEALNEQEGIATDPVTGEQIKRAKRSKPSSQPPPVPTPSPDEQAATLRTFVEKYLSAEEKVLNQQVEKAIRDYSGKTGLSQGIGAGFAVTTPQTIAKLVQDVYGKTVDPSQVSGLSVKGAGGSYGFASRSSGNIGESVAHELTHELVEGVRRGGKDVYGGNVKDLMEKRVALLNENEGVQKGLLSYASKNVTGDNKAILRGAVQDQDMQKYYFDPKEMFAHVGQALISGNAELTRTLKKLYGEELYNELVKSLQTTIPDVFAPENMEHLKKNFGGFNAELRNLTAEGNAPAFQLNPNAQAARPAPADLLATISKVVEQEFAPKAGTPGGGIGDFAKFAQTALQSTIQNKGSIGAIAGEVIGGQGTARRRLADTFKSAAGVDLIPTLSETFADPSEANITKSIKSAKKISGQIESIFRQYVVNTIKDSDNILEGVELFVAQSQLFGKSPKGPNGLQQRIQGGIVGRIAEQFMAPEVDVSAEATKEIRKRTGSNIKEFKQETFHDASSGLNRVAVEAKTLNGVMIELNYSIDAFGRKKLDLPEKQGVLKNFKEQVLTQIPRTITDNISYSALSGLQEMFMKLVSIQDELGEVANLFGKVGEAATNAKADFLRNSVKTAIDTGQGFDEGVQTNLRNLKVLGAIPDTDKRSELANKMSRVQLGAQTVFGISLDQSLESIPAILAQIQDGMIGIEDPAKKTAAAISELQNVMDKMVVAQRTSGAQGDELITIYSRLASSAKEYGLSAEQLIALSASSSVAIGKGSDETSNILKSLLEGTYSEANDSAFQKAGISTKYVNKQSGQIENRSFQEIMGEMYKMSQDDSKSVQYLNLTRSIAGPRNASDFGKIIKGFGTNDQRILDAEQKAPAGVFDSALEARTQNFGAALNKVNAAGTQLLGTFLVSTGLFDRFTEGLNGVAKTAEQISTFFDKNRESVQAFANVIIPIIKYLTVGRASEGTNLLGFLPEISGKIETRIRGRQAQLIDFGNNGNQGTDPLKRNLQIIAAIWDEIAKNSRVATDAMVSGNLKAAESAQLLAKAQGGPTFQLNPQAAAHGIPVNAAAIANLTPGQAVGPTSSDLINEARSREANQAALEQGALIARQVADAEPVLPGQSKLFDIRKPLGRSVAFAGDTAGALAAPVGFDLATGGLGQDNLTKVGVGIAGGIAGAFVGGPFGATIGYTIAGAMSDAFDLPGAFGTSEKELTSLAKAILNLKDTAEQTPQQRDEARGTALKGLEEFRRRTGYDTEINKDVTVQSGGLLGGRGGTGKLRDFQVSSENIAEYKRLVVDNAGSGAMDEAKKFVINDNTTTAVYTELAKNKEFLDAYIAAGVSSLGEFSEKIDQAIRDQKGPLYEALVKLGADKNTDQLKANAQDLVAGKELLTQNVTDFLAQIKETLDGVGDLSVKTDTPYGLQKYGAYGSEMTAYDQRNAGLFTGINKGTLRGDKAKTALERYDYGRESLAQLGETLPTVLPLAQRMGWDTKGIDQSLYKTGAQGQQQLVQGLQPVIQADAFTRQYETKVKALDTLKSSQLFNSKDDDRVRKQYEELKKNVDAEKERYDISKQYLATVAGQTDFLKQQTGELAQQNQARRLISAGTPAEFNAPALVDVKDYTTTQINKALEYAKQKQAELTKLNPGYAKEFAKQQFTLNSGSQYAGVGGVDQSFFNESLQQQKQALTPPETVDLSQFSDEQTQKILGRARDLQGQAVALAPDLKEKYDGERLLILRKNNQLLAQTGLSQEWLRQAIQENTKSNDQLRGHYNLPSSYRAPTVWDYYNQGGKEAGDVNFKKPGGEGMVPMAMAQMLAAAIVNQGPGKAGPDLSGVSGPGVKDARSLKYYSGGTPDVWSEPPPLPEPLKDTLPSSDPRKQRTFNRWQAEEDRRDARAATGRSGEDERHNQTGRAPLSSDDRGERHNQTGPIGDRGERHNQTGAMGESEKNPFSSVVLPLANGAEQTKTSLTGAAQASDTAAHSTNRLGTAAGVAATGLAKSMGALAGATTLAGGITSATTAISGFARALQAFDLAKIFNARNMQMNVYVNGQQVQGQTTVTTNNVGTGGAGLGASGGKTGSAGNGRIPIS